MGAVISFFRPAATCQGGWSQQELAEFYRVEAALLRAGLQIGSEQGLSDEADPWFVFCRPDGDAIMHFARIDGSYVIASEVLDSPMRGSDFRALIDQIARRYPELLPIPQSAGGTKLSVHPAALLAALVAAAALSLSPDDARADDAERMADHASRAPHAGPTHPDGPTEGRDSGDPDERDGHRKQVGLIVFSAMVFAADAFADHPAQGAEARSSFGAPGGITAVPGDQVGLSTATGGAVNPVQAGGPPIAGPHEAPSSGASGPATGGPTAVASSRPEAADLGVIGFRDPAVAQGPARAGADPASQPLVRGADAGAGHAAGSSSSPDGGSDGSAATTGDAAAREQSPPSSSATGEAALASTVIPTSGHTLTEAPPAAVSALGPVAPTELRHAPISTPDERSGSPESGLRAGALPDARERHDAGTVADAPSVGTGASERDQHGADSSVAAALTDLRPSAGIAQVRKDAIDQGGGQTDEGLGRSADAPGHLKEAAAAHQETDSRGAAGNANSGQASGIAQTQPGSAERVQAPLSEGRGRSAEAPGHLGDARSGQPEPNGHDAQDSVRVVPATSGDQTRASSADPRPAPADEGPGGSAEASAHVQTAGPSNRDAHGQSAGIDADPAQPSARAHGRANGTDAGDVQANDSSGGDAPAPSHPQDTASHMQGAGSHGADIEADTAPPSTAADPGHTQTGEAPGRSAEAPGHLQDTAPRAQAAGGHGTADSVDPAPGSTHAQAQVTAAEPDHAQAREAPGRGAEAPGHLQDTAPQAQGAGGHGTADNADPAPGSTHAQAPVTTGYSDNAQASETPGRSAEVPGPLHETGPQQQNSDGRGTATGTNSGIAPSAAHGQTADSASAQPHPDVGPHDAAPDNASAAANVSPPAGPEQAIARQGSGGSTDMGRDNPPSAEQISRAHGGDPGSQPPASIAPSGEIVFATDHKSGPVAGPSPAVTDHGIHGDVGVIGISDHGSEAHLFDHHA
ncbi:hypothetical protein [Methylobacterium mesophilicum]|uniref:hypothetical protein n=1 Tax=Methylobacterium mesophilicum TaxID=39956 RepID=UPI002F2E98F3